MPVTFHIKIVLTPQSTLDPTAVQKDHEKHPHSSVHKPVLDGLFQSIHSTTMLNKKNVYLLPSGLRVYNESKLWIVALARLGL